MSKKRKFNDDYLKYGFTCMNTSTEQKPQCILCGVVLSNESMKPAKLERHLNTCHPADKSRPLVYFEQKALQFKKMKLANNCMLQPTQTAVSLSYEISQMIAKAKKPHSIGETLLKLCILKVAEELFGADGKKKVQEISLSDDTVKRRIDDMALNIEEQLLTKVKTSLYIGLQCDESTDVANCSQLLVFV